jgi:Tat protein secretion system quality control protein TatD with DNase activity
MASRCEPGQVLSETDSPVAFEPLGGAHGPSLIPSVVFKLAELWRMSFEEAREIVCQNAYRFLGEAGKG